MPYSKDFFKRFCQKTGLSEDFAREYSKAAEKINSSYYQLKKLTYGAVYHLKISFIKINYSQVCFLFL